MMDLKEENEMLRKHLGVWKDMYSTQADDKCRMEETIARLYDRVHELEKELVDALQ